MEEAGENEERREARDERPAHALARDDFRPRALNDEKSWGLESCFDFGSGFDRYRTGVKSTGEWGVEA